MARWNERDFIEPVAAHYGCQVTRRRGDGDWELRASTQGIAWHCRLRPYAVDVPPSVVWVAPGVAFDEQRPVPLRITRVDQVTGGGAWDVTAGGWAGAAASAAVLGLGFLRDRRKARRPDPVPAPEPATGPAPEASVLGPGWRVHDPAGVVDGAAAQLFATFPTAHRGQTESDGPSVIDSVWLANHGLEVTSTGWWDSSPALDHQIRLGLTLAQAVRTRRGY